MKKSLLPVLVGLLFLLGCEQAKNNNEKVPTAIVSLSPDYNNYNSKDSINDSLAVKKEALIKEDSSSPQLFLSKEEDMLADPFILNYLNGKIKKYDVTDKRREQSLQQKQT